MRSITLSGMLCLVFMLQGCDALNGIARRRNDDSAIFVTKQFRDSEREFEKSHGPGKYGSLAELKQENFLPGSFPETGSKGYIFQINVIENGYTFRAIPIGYGTSNSEGSFSLFLDQTGLIRSASRKGIDLPVWEIAGPDSLPLPKQ